MHGKDGSMRFTFSKRQHLWLPVLILVAGIGMLCGTTSVLAQGTVTMQTQTEQDSAMADAQSAQDTATAQATDAVETPTLSRVQVNLKPGNHWKLRVSGSSGQVTWKSKNQDVATVNDKGYITAVGEGTTRIIARVDGVKLTCKVKVEAVKKVKIVAVGDNLYHRKVILSGMNDDGTRNYDAIYENVSSYIRQADVAIINQEVLLTADASKWSGYPDFASPLEVGEAVIKAGFNVITCATNHSYDKGLKVALETVDYWKSKASDGVLMVGMYDSQTDYDTIAVSEYNGIKIAFLNYTYGVNGRKPDSDHSYLIKFAEEKLIKKEITKAKKLADVVIVLPHWGTELQLYASSEQKQLAQKMADWGADIIIGTHPHVVQPLEMLTASDGRTVPCYYSLGNFVSNYVATFNPELEGMAEITITKYNGEVKIKTAKLTPLVNHVTYAGQVGDSDDYLSDYTVYKLSDYTDSLAQQHINSLTKRGTVTVAKLKKLFKDIRTGNTAQWQ